MSVSVSVSPQDRTIGVLVQDEESLRSDGDGDRDDDEDVESGHLDGNPEDNHRDKAQDTNSNSRSHSCRRTCNALRALAVELPLLYGYSAVSLSPGLSAGVSGESNRRRRRSGDSDGGDWDLDTALHRHVHAAAAGEKEEKEEEGEGKGKGKEGGSGSWRYSTLLLRAHQELRFWTEHSRFSLSPPLPLSPPPGVSLTPLARPVPAPPSPSPSLSCNALTTVINCAYVNDLKATWIPLALQVPLTH